MNDHKRCSTCIHYEECKEIILASLRAPKDDIETRIKPLLCELPYDVMVQTRDCAYCGNTFNVTHGSQIYCSKECRDKAQVQKKKARA